MRSSPESSWLRPLEDGDRELRCIHGETLSMIMDSRDTYKGKATRHCPKATSFKTNVQRHELNELNNARTVNRERETKL